MVLQLRSRFNKSRPRRFKEYWSIQGKYPGGRFEEVTAEDHIKEARQRLKEYQDNEPEYPHRMIFRKEKSVIAQMTPEQKEMWNTALKASYIDSEISKMSDEQLEDIAWDLRDEWK